MVREAVAEDLEELLQLYLHLHEQCLPVVSEHYLAVWNQILGDENCHLIVNIIDNRILSSCVCAVIPNLTRNGRPYALIENVVTHKDYRGKGYASECLNYAKNIAVHQKCYKMMLLTGAKDQKTLDFYQNAGYNSTDKTAFIQWLDME